MEQYQRARALRSAISTQSLFALNGVSEFVLPEDVYVDGIVCE